MSTYFIFVLLRFPGCTWTLAESEFEALVWAEKLIQLDAAQFPQWLNRTRVFAKSLDKRGVSKPRPEFQMGAGIGVWIEMVPPESRLLPTLKMRCLSHESPFASSLIGSPILISYESNLLVALVKSA
jgi:hypothetical protein